MLLSCISRAAAKHQLNLSVLLSQGRLGGGEGIEGLYGSLKRMSMQTVLDLMVAKCGLSSKSHLVDVGAGLGRYSHW